MRGAHHPAVKVRAGNTYKPRLDCIREGTPPLVSVDDGIEALRLSLAMEAAAETGATVTLDDFGATELGAADRTA